MATAHVFVDYQNVHLSAFECFARYHEAKHDYLVHPARFADQVCAAWTTQHGEELTAEKITMYRGLPDPRKEGKANSRVLRQHSMWKRDTRVVVETRPLRYPRDWPDTRAQEKGVDVMMALAIVRCALAKSCDRIIVATRDTDMLPAIEMAEVENPGSIVIATWDGNSVLRTTPPVPTVQLGQQAFNKSRDTNIYS
ncbi:MAG TPA: NYN domain-containing protein [Microbacterium sp.]|uniref:NYN domain-containing protein n=1 Tax=Microbacterium sp. TaxID=51671 RepID=UPI002CF2D96F|nr:NYN domain-containing protein [Microbacterium sp.]HWI29865.1 NYN domain-containing protein [Microbacterium sp.]